MRYSFGAFVTIAALWGCAPVMAVTRPDPVDLKQFVIGDPHLKVTTAFGAPLDTVTDDAGHSCDVYRLYTHNADPDGKYVSATREAVLDVLTAGFSEIVFTPLEITTIKNGKRKVTFCYDKDDNLIGVNESAAPVAKPTEPVH
jgi:hypothetical protein